jgi:hypothetical protein
LCSWFVCGDKEPSSVVKSHVSYSSSSLVVAAVIMDPDPNGFQTRGIECFPCISFIFNDY